MANPDQTLDDVALADGKERSLTHSQLKVPEDYLALREHAGATPDLAAALTAAIQTNELRLAVAGVQGLLVNWSRDPMRAVTWLRQFALIQSNFDEADTQILKGDVDAKFEAAPKTMHDTPNSGGTP